MQFCLPTAQKLIVYYIHSPRCDCVHPLDGSAALGPFSVPFVLLVDDSITCRFGVLRCVLPAGSTGITGHNAFT